MDKVKVHTSSDGIATIQFAAKRVYSNGKFAEYAVIDGNYVSLEEFVGFPLYTGTGEESGILIASACAHRGVIKVTLEGGDETLLKNSLYLHLLEEGEEEDAQSSETAESTSKTTTKKRTAK